MKIFARHYLESFGINTDSMTDFDVTQEFRNVTLFLRNKLLNEPRRDTLYTHSEVGYITPKVALEETCVACRNYIPGGNCLLVGGKVNPTGTCQLWQPWTEENTQREDSNEPTKKVINWNGLKIGVTHIPGDTRFGYPLRDISYGRIYRSYGNAEDGRAIDCWIGPNLDSDKAFWFQQLDPEDGSPDEMKLVIGFPDRVSAKQALQDNLPLYLREAMFGGLFDMSPTELDMYRVDAINLTELDAVYAKYHQTVNMSASELKRWAESEDSKKASLDRSPIARNLRLLAKPKDKWTSQDIRDANRTIGFVSRMKGAEQGQPVDKDTKLSKRDISLKNWAYDPKKRGDTIESAYHRNDRTEESDRFFISSIRDDADRKGLVKKKVKIKGKHGEYEAVRWVKPAISGAAVLGAGLVGAGTIAYLNGRNKSPSENVPSKATGFNKAVAARVDRKLSEFSREERDSMPDSLVIELSAKESLSSSSLKVATPIDDADYFWVDQAKSNGKELLQHELDGIRSYVGGGYSTMNYYLGAIDDRERAKALRMDPLTRQKVDSFESALDKLPPFTGKDVPLSVKHRFKGEDLETVFTNGDLPDNAYLNRYSAAYPGIENIEPGRILFEPRFTSTSTLREPNLSFTLRHHIEKNISKGVIVYRIKPRRDNTKAVYIGNNKGEAEVLFKPRTTFRVVDVKEETILYGRKESVNARVIYLEEN